MDSLELTQRLIADMEKIIAVDTTASSVNSHLNLIAQLINLGGEVLIGHEPDTEVDVIRFYEDVVKQQEKISQKIEYFIDEDPFVTMPDNESFAAALIKHLGLLHAAITL